MVKNLDTGIKSSKNNTERIHSNLAETVVQEGPTIVPGETYNYIPLTCFKVS